VHFKSADFGLPSDFKCLVILKREPASGAGATKDGVDRRTSRCKNDVLPAVQQSAEVRTLRESTANNMTCALEGGPVR
jgi:hypothetical protein